MQGAKTAVARAVHEQQFKAVVKQVALAREELCFQLIAHIVQKIAGPVEMLQLQISKAFAIHPGKPFAALEEEEDLAKKGIKIDKERMPPRYYLEAPKNFNLDQVIFGPLAERFEDWKTYLKIGSRLKLDSDKVKQSHIRFRD